MNNEMENYKQEFKKNLQYLIEEGQLEEAKEMIQQYEAIVKDDVEIASMKAVILIMEHEFKEAMKLLIKSLNNYGENFDLLFNLAYLYELNSNYEKAYYYYSKANEKCTDNEMKENIKGILDNLKTNHNVNNHKKRKSVLMIAQIFPPMGGSGVQRTLKFVKYLRKFGWEPVVVTVGNTAFNYLKDPTLEKEIPENLEIVRFDEKLNFTGNEATNLLNKYEKLINNDEIICEYKNIINNLSKENNGEELLKAFLIPDYSSFWAMDVLDKIDEYIDFNSIDILYSTSGPYSDHIIGYFLKDRFNKPWVCDFRDEWTNNPYVNFDKSGIVYNIMRNMEINILNRCNMIITTTPLAKENYINDLNIPESKVIVITNGYDEEDFKNIPIDAGKRDKFRIMHNGLLYMIRTPETFFQAIRMLLDNKRIDKDKIEVIFSYTENKDKWLKYLRENNMESIVKFNDYMSHNESIKLSMNSDMLLLIVGSGEKNKGVYTGKVFEYLRMGKPILALSPKQSVVEKLLNETNCGMNFEFEDVNGISNYIYKEYKDWQNSIKNKCNSSKLITKYERKNLTRKLANIFDEIYELDVKLKNAEHLLYDDCNLIDNNLEYKIKNALINNDNDYRLLRLLGYFYYRKQKYYEAYKFNNMALINTGNNLIKNEIEKLNLKILSENNIAELERRKKLELILVGETIDKDILSLIQSVGNINNIVNTSHFDVKEIREVILRNTNFDYIVIMEKDDDKFKSIISELMLLNIDESKIFDFYSYNYPYYIEGFEYKLNSFLKKSRIDMLVTGLSYGEIGLDCNKINIPSFNFALSGQDIFFDYQLFKFLLKFSNLKNNIKYVLISMGYYAFDYDLSKAEQCTRIHRYYADLGETHNYNNILHLRLCNALYKMHDYENDYKMYHNYKLNTKLNLKNRKQEDKIAIRQATMNYPETRKENKLIFKIYLDLLTENNIVPIITVLPVSKYYRKFYEDNYQKDKFYKIMNEFKINYKFEIFDYFHNDMFEDEDFFDYSHLNKYGAERFTNMLMERLGIS
ncbi:hypothetical protein CLLI_08840 [Clostridium liquoris]|jgi:glycosyltransferase involved in cell wall biosynthesis|uniref:Uncharacterized protein n=1 Tax=Clostridium liquoris TaxID=1289519 RepID=A0A2T0B683_9CLOT|nr:hypothetical protein [Clostridium liquoris]PRR79404.1 hypothetical protein CLLI_08840 [Clostridium liquoris]